jgi:hypothetical protein
MGWKGLERNKLDYILTDLLPVELSELFSFRPLYDFLLGKSQQKTIALLIEQLKRIMAEGKETMFFEKLATMPLKYNILKGTDSTREMSVMQPLSALNIFFFMECYQKDILNHFGKHHCFSIRYHKKNTELYYKTKSKRETQYFQRQSLQTGKGIVQQTGSYFKIAPFESINSFSDSRIWRLCNFHFSYYAKIDYKSCFDSIYSHAYNWIIERNVVDSKDAKNSNLFIAIDRILQNINGRSSNGLIVGPEFSRMIAEVLLQQIDSEVFLALSNKKMEQGKEYNAFRYVDDIFIFSNSQEHLNIVIDKFKSISEKYLLHLNELKLSKGETPCLPKAWLEKTRHLSDRFEGFFFTGNKSEFDKLPDNERHLVKDNYIHVDRIKDEIVVLMKEFPDDRRTTVSFLLSMLLNNISKKKDGYILFGQQALGRALLIIDLILYIYAFCPSFDQTRKLISMIVYMNDELNFTNDVAANDKLQKVIRRYSFIFKQGNLHDLCDWFAFFSDFKISLDTHTETSIIENAKETGNPILWGNILLYSRYFEPFYIETKSIIENIIEARISRITEKEPMLHNEFWFVLVFHNCPYLSVSLRRKIDDIIAKIKSSTTGNKPYSIMTRLVCEFLQQQSSSGNKPDESIFNWKYSKGISGQITYRTYQRTIFKHYRGNKYGLYTSVD